MNEREQRIVHAVWMFNRLGFMLGTWFYVLGLIFNA